MEQNKKRRYELARYHTVCDYLIEGKLQLLQLEKMVLVSLAAAINGEVQYMIGTLCRIWTITEWPPTLLPYRYASMLVMSLDVDIVEYLIKNNSCHISYLQF